MLRDLKDGTAFERVSGGIYKAAMMEDTRRKCFGGRRRDNTDDPWDANMYASGVSTQSGNHYSS